MDALLFTLNIEATKVDKQKIQILSLFIQLFPYPILSLYSLFSKIIPIEVSYGNRKHMIMNIIQ